jgi:hypothetical protein
MANRYYIEASSQDEPEVLRLKSSAYVLFDLLASGITKTKSFLKLSAMGKEISGLYYTEPDCDMDLLGRAWLWRKILPIRKVTDGGA